MRALVPGQAVDLELPGQESAVRVRALVEKLVGDEYELVIPHLQERPAGLRPGVRVVVRYVSPGGRHEATSFLVQVAAGATPRATLGKLENVQTFQQREHFRAFTTLPVDVTAVESSVKGLAGQRDQRATSVDISAGGMRFDTELPLAADDRVLVTVRLTKELRQGNLPESMAVEARVVRAERHDSGQLRVAVQSRFPREVERDKWVQLTLNLQRRKP